MHKIFVLVVFGIMWCHTASSQDFFDYYVIEDQLVMYEKPETNSTQLAKMSLGTKIGFTGEGSSGTEMISGVSQEINWSKIVYQGKEGWIFSEGICERYLPTLFSEPLDTIFDNNQIIRFEKSQQAVQELIQQNRLTLEVNTLRFRAKNGEEILVKENICRPHESEPSDGYRIDFIERNTANPSLIEIEMGMVAFDLKCYINLETGKKFNFPQDKLCGLSEVSPSGKYVIGRDLYSEKFELFLFDFDTQKLLKKTTLAIESYYVDINWLDDSRLQVDEMDEQGLIIKQMILDIPSLSLKK